MMKKMILYTLVLITACLQVSPVVAIDYKKTEPLLTTDTTVIGEPIYYPGGGKADIRAIEVIMLPGDKTSWHKHGVPLFAYILSGTLHVNYGDKGERAYRPGDSFMEAMDQFHQGENRGKETVKILALFMGGNKQKLVIPKN
jgi:quercetin dioxygenase-like cupin family protein